MNPNTTPILPGMKVRCRVTGYTGIVDHRVDYLDSGPRISIAGPLTSAGEVPDEHTTDETAVEILDPVRLVERDAPPARLAMGQKAKDPVTDFSGTVIARAIYINGCARIALQPPVKKDGDRKGDYREAIFFPENRLEPLNSPPPAREKPTAGGPAGF